MITERATLGVGFYQSVAGLRLSRERDTLNLGLGLRDILHFKNEVASLREQPVAVHVEFTIRINFQDRKLVKSFQRQAVQLDR